jgi:hypothetical protein
MPMAHVRYNSEQRVFIYDCYVGKKNSYKSCKRKLCLKFPDTICPSGDTISKLVKKVQTHSILIDRNPCCVLTKEKLDDIGRWLENSPWKSLQRLAHQSGVSVGSAFTATELLHIHLYKITVVPEFKPVRFCGLSVMCLTDFLILSWHFSQMRLTLISQDKLTHKTTGTGVVKILMP